MWLEFVQFHTTVELRRATITNPILKTNHFTNPFCCNENILDTVCSTVLLQTVPTTCAVLPGNWAIFKISFSSLQTCPKWSLFQYYISSTMQRILYMCKDFMSVKNNSCVLFTVLK